MDADVSSFRQVLTSTQTALSDADIYCGHGYADPHDEAVALVLAAAGLSLHTGAEILDQPFPDDALHVLNEYIQHRVERRVPVAYIICEAWLGPCRFIADPRALVPRSPIAEVVLDEFAPWWQGKHAPGRIVDVCCGGGSLGLLAAHVFPSAEVVLMDLDSDALALASENRAAMGGDQNIHVVKADLLSPLSDNSVDVILANPPYVDSVEMAALPAEYHHEPRQALAAGADGLDLIPALFAQAARVLKPEGLMFLEVGNSWSAMESAYPDSPFVWVELAQGGCGVAVITHSELGQLATLNPNR